MTGQRKVSPYGVESLGAVKVNKNSFPGHIHRKRKTRENMGLVLYGAEGQETWWQRP